MHNRHRRSSRLNLLSSKTAIALPVTFLMLFVSLTILISATYYFSITKISAKTAELKALGAEQEMLALERHLEFVLWAPGSYEIYEFEDFAGEFKVLPESNRIILNLTDNNSFNDTFLNDTTGKIIYELPPTENYDEAFLKGDDRVIVNQSSSTTTQLAIYQGAQHYEIALSYRPLVGSTLAGLTGDKPTNDVRIYLVNLDQSQTIMRLGSFRLKITCTDVVSSKRSYDFTSPISSLSIKAVLNNALGEVSVPISSNSQGAAVSLETVTCNIRIEDAGW